MSLEVGDCALGILEQPAAAHVDDRRDLGERAARLLREIDERAQHLWREVVDDVPAEILEGVAHRRPSRAGHAGDDEHLLAVVLGHQCILPAAASLVAQSLHDR